MSKWIAEFDLEDGDTMPEHMDLNYMGAKIDFHCRPMWIPVSERLPDAQKNGDKDFSDWVQVTINLGKDNPPCVSEAYYCFSTNKWYTERVVIGEVVAWMPLPEPFEPESEG